MLCTPPRLQRWSAIDERVHHFEKQKPQGGIEQRRMPEINSIRRGQSRPQVPPGRFRRHRGAATRQWPKSIPRTSGNRPPLRPRQQGAPRRPAGETPLHAFAGRPARSDGPHHPQIPAQSYFEVAPRDTGLVYRPDAVGAKRPTGLCPAPNAVNAVNAVIFYC